MNTIIHKYFMEQPAFVSNPKKGIISLLFTLIVGSVALSIAVTMLILSTDISLSAGIFRESNQAKSLANACGEYALEAIRDNPSVSGTVDLPPATFSTGTCRYTIIINSPTNRTVNAQGTSGTTVRKIQAQIFQIRPKILLTSWQEIADF